MQPQRQRGSAASTMAPSKEPPYPIVTTLTNPGIIDRLEQDIADYLSPFGYRLERKFDHDARTSSTTDATAVLTVPRLPYNYSTTNRAGAHEADGRGPIGTLHLHVHQESLLMTVGPLLRTFVRLSPHQISPRRFRSVVHCHFVLNVLEMIDKMNSEQKRQQLDRQEESSARRMAHHVHMLVRNSMGSALCLELVVVLPRYWRRKSPETNGAVDGRIGTNVPVTEESVRTAMNDNPDACYPSVQLVEQREDGVDKAGDACGIDSSDTSIHLHVKTRMCTVRDQPILFRWLHSLQHPTTNSDGNTQCGEGMDSGNSKPFAIHSPPGSTMGSIPLVVACIEKVGNLHRVLMLCHDYDSCHSVGGDDAGHTAQSSLLSNVVVVLPNVKEDDRGQAQGGDNRDGEPRKAKILRDFENALDHFHKVIIGEEIDSRACQMYRLTLVFEDEAGDTIRNAIERRQSHSSAPFRPCIVGIDLHPDALTLNGDYATTKLGSPALNQMRGADAIIFGYESSGIPKPVAVELTHWVQIPSRSSINVVAAMSIILDALMGSGSMDGK